MEGLTAEIIVEQVKGIIIGAIERFASKMAVPRENLGIWIYAPDNDGLPKLKLLVNLKPFKEISFGDLTSRFEKILYGAIFDAEKDTPIWIQKFIIKSAKDSGLGVTVAKYLLVIMEDEELHAFMYVNGKMIKEIPIEYILETK
jgi:hypothetical protein